MLFSLTAIVRLGLIRSCFLCALLPILGVSFSQASADEPASLVNVLVTYHSLSGHTERMAEAVADGVKSVSG
ncbi:MAG: hypothetical protein ABI988_19515, partial [Nitrospirota bacterium]